MFRVGIFKKTSPPRGQARISSGGGSLPIFASCGCISWILRPLSAQRRGMGSGVSPDYPFLGAGEGKGSAGLFGSTPAHRPDYRPSNTGGGRPRLPMRPLAGILYVGFEGVCIRPGRRPPTIGKQFEFRCLSCGYRVEVSGGEDCGMVAVTRTMTCNDCQELVDVQVGFTAPSPYRKSDKCIGRCPRCGSTNVTPWGKGRPCPSRLLKN